MIYWFNEARNVAEYRAEKAAREKAEQDKKDKQYGERYYGKNKSTSGFVRKIRADGQEDIYYTDIVGDQNRKVISVKGSRKGHMASGKDMLRDADADTVADRNTKSRKERNEFRDAVNRNMRRHPERWDGDKPAKPKTESTIFDNIEII